METTNIYVQEVLDEAKYIQKALQEKKKRLGLDGLHTLWIFKKRNDQWHCDFTIHRLQFDTATKLFDIIAANATVSGEKTIMKLTDPKGEVIDLTNLINLSPKNKKR